MPAAGPAACACALGDFDLTQAAVEEIGTLGVVAVGWDERRTNPRIGRGCP